MKHAPVSGIDELCSSGPSHPTSTGSSSDVVLYGSNTRGRETHVSKPYVPPHPSQHGARHGMKRSLAGLGVVKQVRRGTCAGPHCPASLGRSVSPRCQSTSLTRDRVLPIRRMHSSPLLSSPTHVASAATSAVPLGGPLATTATATISASAGQRRRHRLAYLVVAREVLRRGCCSC